MATCPVCGMKHRKLQFEKCEDCGREGCTLSRMGQPAYSVGQYVEKWASDSDVENCCIYYKGSTEREYRTWASPFTTWLSKGSYRIPPSVWRTHRDCPAMGAKGRLESAENALKGIIHGHSLYEDLLSAAEDFRKYAPILGFHPIDKALQAERMAEEVKQKRSSRS